MRDIIGSDAAASHRFPGWTVTAEIAASGGVKTEDTPFTVAVSSLIGNDTDADGDPITFVSVQGAVGGTVSEAGGYITFMPAANYFGAASFTYTIRDSAGLTDTATASFNINNVNDAPVLDLDANNSTIGGGGSLVTYNPGGAAIRLTDTDVSIADVDNPNILGANISLLNAQAGDALGFSGALPGGITYSNFGTTIALSGPASHADYAAAIETITFSSSNGSTAQRSVSVTILDGDGGAMATTALININRAPAITSVENGSVTEDSQLIRLQCLVQSGLRAIRQRLVKQCGDVVPCAESAQRLHVPFLHVPHQRLCVPDHLNERRAAL